MTAINQATRRVRAGQPVSEGTTSACQILRTVPITRFRGHEAMATRHEPLRNIKPARLHRVDQIEAPATCPPGVCMGLGTCKDLNCQGHPANAVREDERDERLTRWVWGLYSATALGVVAWFFY